ncbi:hypothetical protein CspHIS471_0305060 [Cutaneotrichosporon sp. HIS471]|nr:hypothetical protein CspHIS471_0305060 [Cutaneotrichosporon sp. HIS471]
MAVPLKSGFELDDDPATPRTDATVCFRDLIPHPTHPRIAGISTHEAHSWCASRRAVLALAWLIKRLDVSNLETTPQILDLIHDILRPSLSKEGGTRLTSGHLAGARQENRIVPYQGLPISSMTPNQREEIYALIQAFNIYLPAGPLQAKMQRVRSFEDQTYFAWIGKYGLGDPYYFRIHSPVVFCEFDFHCGSEFGIHCA